MDPFDLAVAAQRFADDPASARTAPAVTATLANGHARLSSGPFNWDADLPQVLGGGAQAPSPTAYLLGALAGCAVTFLADTLAPEFNVDVVDASATARCTSDLAGLVGIAGSSPQLHGLAIEIEIDSPSPTDRVDAMQRAWLERCPVLLALRQPNDVPVAFASGVRCV